MSFKTGENVYLNTQSKRPHGLPKLDSFVIDSVAWNKAPLDGSSTREILLGTNKGVIFEAEIDIREGTRFNDKRNVEQVYVIDGKESIQNPAMGLRFFPFPGSEERKYLIMMTTVNRLFQFVGTVPQNSRAPIFRQIFVNYESNPSFQELPSNLQYSELRFFYGDGDVPKAFAWLSGPGVFYGKMLFRQQGIGDLVTSDPKLLQYPTVNAEARRRGGHDRGGVPIGGMGAPLLGSCATLHGSVTRA